MKSIGSKADLLVYNSSQLLTLSGKDGVRIGKDMEDLGSLAHGAIAVKDGIVVETGPTDNLLTKYHDVSERIDAGNKLVMPGFVDCHTHLVFAGSRENEMSMRVSGGSYIEILKSGGGIHSTVEATREASYDDLLKIAESYITYMISHGTTTVEIKSGYGLSYESEKKILEVIKKLSREQKLDIISTFLGAHTVPHGVDRNEYLDMLINIALPEFRGMTEFCDIFAEDGAFTYQETERFLCAAKDLGYKLKVHSGQFNDIGVTGLSAKLDAYSADHLEYVSDDQLELMKEARTAAVLMPGVPFFLMLDKYADARRMIQNGNAVALATDFNPGSCPTFSMQMIIALACYKMKMTAEEAITASTINAAYAIDRADDVGSLEIGKKADLLIMDIVDPVYIPYYFGANLVNTVIKNGELLYRKT